MKCHASSYTGIFPILSCVLKSEEQGWFHTLFPTSWKHVKPSWTKALTSHQHGDFLVYTCLCPPGQATPRLCCLSPMTHVEQTWWIQYGYVCPRILGLPTSGSQGANYIRIYKTTSPFPVMCTKRNLQNPILCSIVALRFEWHYLKMHTVQETWYRVRRNLRARLVEPPHSQGRFWITVVITDPRLEEQRAQRAS